MVMPDEKDKTFAQIFSMRRDITKDAERIATYCEDKGRHTCQQEREAKAKIASLNLCLTGGDEGESDKQDKASWSIETLNEICRRCKKAMPLCDACLITEMILEIPEGESAKENL